MDELRGQADEPALVSNPFLGSDDEPARILATVGARVAGRLDLLPGLIDTQAGEVRSFWGSRLHVSPEARRRRLGRELLRAAEARCEAAGACAPSRAAYPPYVQLGYTDIPLRRFVLVRRTGPLVERWLVRGVAARGATTAGDALPTASLEVGVHPAHEESWRDRDRLETLALARALPADVALVDWRSLGASATGP